MIQTSTFTQYFLLKEVVTKYFIFSKAVVRLYYQSMNHTYIVIVDSKKYFLRISLPHMTKQAVQAEVDFLNYLANNNFNAVRPIPRLDGDYLTIIKAPEGNRVVVITDAVEGIHCKSSNSEQEKARYRASQRYKLEGSLRP